MTLKLLEFIPLMTIMAIITFMVQRHHLLMSLLSLEGVILSLTFLFMMSVSSVDYFVGLLLLTFGACEASLGLSCLVFMMRTVGSDHYKFLNSVKC